MHPLFQKAHLLTIEVISSALEVQRHFGPGLLGDRGIARVILAGADAP